MRVIAYPVDLGKELNNSFRDLLRLRKEAVLADWFDRILDACPDGTAAFLKKRQDRFANPVAYAFREATEAIYGALLDETEVDAGAVDWALKIRAVQENNPDKGIAFIRLAKDAVRAKLGDSAAQKDFADLDCRIEQIASTASDQFLAHRRKVAEIGKGHLPAEAALHRCL